VVFSPLLHPKIVPTSDTGPRSFHVKATAIPDGSLSWWALLSVEDVSVLAHRVEELRALQVQQERMMREIHHRVKNSLNMISGLITMQRSQPGIEAAQGPLGDLQSRIVAISEIHDILYHSSNLSSGSAAEYLETLAHLLDRNLSFSDNHQLVLDLDRSVVLKTDSTVLLGLIQTELMTNALKYGLGNRRGEVLSIGLARTGPRSYEYTLSHSGDRLPESFDPATSTGLGMVLLTAYASQLGTTLGWSRGDPTRFWLRFHE
jgi:two-component sensor histidine kinase